MNDHLKLPRFKGDVIVVPMGGDGMFRGLQRQPQHGVVRGVPVAADDAEHRRMTAVPATTRKTPTGNNTAIIIRTSPPSTMPSADLQIPVTALLEPLGVHS